MTVCRQDWGCPKGGLDESIQAFWADTTVARMRGEEVGMTRNVWAELEADSFIDGHPVVPTTLFLLSFYSEMYFLFLYINACLYVNSECFILFPLNILKWPLSCSLVSSCRLGFCICLFCWFDGGLPQLVISGRAPGRGKYSWRTAPIGSACRQVCGGVFYRVMDVDSLVHPEWWGHPWTGGSEFYKKAGWAGHR